MNTYRENIFALIESTMRYILLLTCSVLLAFASGAQIKMPASTKAGLHHLEELSKKNTTISPNDYSGYPVQLVKNDLYVSLYGKMKNNPDRESLQEKGVLFGSSIKSIATIKVPLAQLSSITFEDVFEYIELPGLISPALDKTRKATHTDSVHYGINLPQAYTGENVIIGVTDWGFDYTHPMFYDTLLQQTRILAAWDQFKQVGTPPNGYDYGAEYIGAAELLAAQKDTANIYSYGTHGTHVAGIAGGSGIETAYRGMAPSSDFLFATFLIDAASVIDAFVWMKNKAQEEDKRLVINMSWGLYYMGTLDGTSLLSQAIDNLSEEGVVFVTSAGNNGSDLFHIKKTFDNDTITSRVRFDSYSFPNYWGQSITMWGEPSKAFDAKISVYNNADYLLTEAPFFYTSSSDSYTVDTLYTPNNDIIYYNVTVDDAHPLNNRPHIRWRVKCTNTNLRVVITAAAEDGTVHFWNVAELTTEVGNWGIMFSGFGTHGMNGDSNYSISEPACAESVISVAAYNSEWNNSGVPTGGEIAGFTSIGPLITEIMKPDIAAPGVNVASSVSSFTNSSYSTAASVTFNGTEYDFSRFSGTSMASPCVAGIVALMLQADPTLTHQQIKDILHNTARLDSYTGNISAPGHPRWGYGKVNAYKAIKSVAPTVSVENLLGTPLLTLMPNPAIDYFNIQNNGNEKIQTVRAITMTGKFIQLQFEQNRVNCSSLPTGVYIIEVITVNSSSHSTFIKL